jgi:C-terminal processing protease CtpA/Prc
MIGQIQAKSYLRDCERTNLATGYIPINIGVGHTGIFPDPEYTQDNGFGVIFVIEGSPADKAGIIVGDFITKVNDKPVKNYNFLLGCIGGDNYKTVKLEVLRQGKIIEYEINKKMINKYNFR